MHDLPPENANDSDLLRSAKDGLIQAGWKTQGFRVFDLFTMSQTLQNNTSELGKSKIRITLMMVDAMQPLDNFEKNIVVNNIKEEEHTVVAIIMWLRLLPTEDRDLMHEYGLDCISAANIPSVSALLDSLRITPNTSIVRTRLVLLTRKYSQLAGRDLLPADWGKEKSNSSLFATLREASLPPYLYSELFNRALEEVMLGVESTLTRRTPVTINEWWDRRALNTPSGSSNWRHTLDGYKTSHHASNDRPNKRSVYSSLPQDTPQQMLARRPHINARCSTKPEPGRKHRALYAACDCSSIVSSYASLGFEESMRFDGMVAKQTPNDVLDWLQNHHNSNFARGHWLSLDYSDFNKEHRPYEQAAINYRSALMWNSLSAVHGAAAANKAHAALWVARSYHNRHARQGDDQWRVHSGLFSGERNTARDNTLLHRVYQKIVEYLLRVAFPKNSGIIKTHMCGDDEDTLFATREQALQYYAVGAACGWHFNPRKQMLSQTHHEFLQILAAGREAPTQPLIAAIVAFVTGSWYKSPVLDLYGLPDAVLRNAAALHNRGAQLGPTVALAHKYLNSIFRWKYRVHKRWDALLSDSMRQEKFCHAVVGLQIPPPVERKYASDELKLIMRAIPSIGVQRTVDTHWPLICTLTPGQQNAVIDTIRFDAYGNWFSAYRNAHPQLPEIPNGKPSWGNLSATITVPSLQDCIFIGMHSTRPAGSMTRERAAAITGIPLLVLNMIDIPRCIAAGHPQLVMALSEADEQPLDQQLLVFIAFLVGHG
jgi:hypothetical protein